MAQLSESRHINLFLAQYIYRATLAGAISKYYSFTPQWSRHRFNSPLYHLLNNKQPAYR